MPTSDQADKKSVPLHVYDRFGRPFLAHQINNQTQAQQPAISQDANDAHDDVHRDTHSKPKCDGHGDLHGVRIERHVNADDAHRIPAQKVRLFGCEQAGQPASKQENHLINLTSKL